MRILMINGSPKKKGGASRFLSKVMRVLLKGHEVIVENLCTPADFNRIMEKLSSCETVILSAPLYVDAMPSHVLAFLHKAESYCIEHQTHFKLYAISNNGFIEGKQNRIHLQMYQCWCERSGNEWGGGIGIGGGVMLHVISIVYPIVLVVKTLLILLSGSISLQPFQDILINLLTWLFLESGVIYCMLSLAGTVRHKGSMKDKFTRVMLPSFLFIFIADIFMFISGLLNGRFVFTLLKKDKVQ